MDKALDCPFESVGYIEIAPSKKSLRLKITPESSIFEDTYYINLDSMEQLLKGHRKEATIFQRKEEVKNDE